MSGSFPALTRMAMLELGIVKGSAHFELRKNAAGIDLNRNFPRPSTKRPVWITLDGWRTGSDDPNNAFYRGPEAFSEPETRVVETLSSTVRFHAGLNSHSTTMGTVIFPCLLNSAHSREYGKLSKTFRSAQTRWRYRRLSARWLDTFTGEQEDWQHHHQDMWSVCIEHYALWTSWTRFAKSQALFWRFNPVEPRVWVDNDVPGVAAYFRAALSTPPPSEFG